MPVTVGSYHQARFSGQLCAAGPAAGQALQILVPGATYTAWYWSPPASLGLYGYVSAATRAGWATWAVDRPGMNGPPYPPAADLTIATEAAALHQAITAAHRWGYRRVVVVGHSLGSYIAMLEAARYHDETALILTGMTSNLNPATLAAAPADLWPAADDPAFSDRRPRPANYLTTRHGIRATVFCGPDCTAAVNRADEALKSTATAGEIGGVTAAASPAVSRAVTVPVLLVVGSQDLLNCGPGPGLSCASAAAILAREAGDFSRAARLRAFVLPASGHDVNLAPDAALWIRAAIAWATPYLRHSDGTPQAARTHPAADPR